MLQLIKKLITYTNNIQFRCYENELNEHIKVEPIPEYILIQTGTITGGQSLDIPLSRYESPLKPESIFVSGTLDRNEQLEIKILNTLTSPNSTVFIKYLDSDNLAFEFPPIILFPINTIQLTANKDVLNCAILFKLAAVLDSWNLAESQ